MAQRKKILIIAVSVVLVLGAVLAILARSFMNRNRVPVVYSDIVEHFKYGSIGTEKRLGVPAPLFALFPVMLAALLPQDRPGWATRSSAFCTRRGTRGRAAPRSARCRSR